MDARGATINYSYDNRGLTTQVSTTSPNTTTIPITPTVTMSYDNLGNRTQMTDGLGTQSYEYNQLSQLTAETKQFSGISGSFTTQYAYNLSGVLKEINDPANSANNVAYSYNKVGAVTTISGGNNAPIVQNRQFRAWGGIKREEYSDGKYVEQEFDNSLRVSRHKVANQAGNSLISLVDYQYTATGNLKRTDDSLSLYFNRNFQYDQVGRLTSSHADFNGNEGASYAAYAENMQYNAFGETTSRVSSKWNFFANYHSQFSNGRTTSSSVWFPAQGNGNSETPQHNAEGQAIQTGAETHKFNAVGQQVETIEQNAPQTNRTQLLIQQSYDGNGQVVKRFSQTTPLSGSPTQETLYFLRSSALGGKVIAEINAQGQKTANYSYKDNGELVNQVVTPMIGNVDGKQFDPFGGEVPTTPVIEGTPDWLDAGNYRSSGNPFDSNGGCQRNGFPIDCAEVVRDVMFGDPRTMNDTVPSLGGGGGMWLSADFPNQQGVMSKNEYTTGAFSWLSPSDERYTYWRTPFSFASGDWRRRQSGQQNENPNCILNAVKGATLIGRYYDPKNVAGHDGWHVIGGTDVIALPIFQGGKAKGKIRNDGYGGLIVDIELTGKGKGYTAILKDFEKINIKVDKSIVAGQKLGSVRMATLAWGNSLQGLHFSVIKSQYLSEYRNLTAIINSDESTEKQIKEAQDIQQRNSQFWFIDPLSNDSPFRCNNVTTYIDPPYDKNGKPTKYPIGQPPGIKP